MVQRDLFWQAWPIIAKWRKAEVQAKKEMVARLVFQAWVRVTGVLPPDLVSSSGSEMDHRPSHSSSSSSTDDEMTEWIAMNDGYAMNAPSRTAMNARYEVAMKAAIKAGMRRWLGGMR